MCRWGVALVFAWLTVTCLAPQAEASKRYPKRYAVRPLTLPDRVFRLDAGLEWQVQPGPNLLKLDLGLAVGATPDLELGSILLPVLLEPDTQYLAPIVYGIYRMTRGAAQSGWMVGVRLPVDSDLLLSTGPPARVRFGDSVRLDVAALLDLVFGEDLDLDTGLRLPGALALQLTPTAFMGPEWQLSFPNFDGARLGAGVLFGVTMGERRAAVADLVFRMWMPDFGAGLDVVVFSGSLSMFFDV